MPRDEMSITVFHVLVALAAQDRHGYSIMRDVAERTDGQIKLSPGTLYGAIRRLLEEGLSPSLMKGRTLCMTMSDAGITG